MSRKLFLSVIAVTTALIFGAPFAHAVEGKRLPNEIVGAWCAVKQDSDEYEHCNVKESDNSTMVVSKHNIFMYGEEGCDFTKVQKIDRRVYYVHGDCGGEGMSWKSTMIFQLLPDGHMQIVFVRHTDEKREG
jgi:hypothetical protein